MDLPPLNYTLPQVADILNLNVRVIAEIFKYQEGSGSLIAESEIIRYLEGATSKQTLTSSK